MSVTWPGPPCWPWRARRRQARRSTSASAPPSPSPEVAQLLAKQLGVDIDPEVTGKFRAGDIRHCWADPTRAEKLLGFTAEIPLEAGVAELIDWVSNQTADDRVDKAYAELGRRGLAS